MQTYGEISVENRVLGKTILSKCSGQYCIYGMQFSSLIEESNSQRTLETRSHV